VAQLRQSFVAFREVFRNPGLRRLQLAYGGSVLGTWAWAIGVVVYAYEHGGAGAVGLVGLIRWTAGAVASPFGAVLGDRYDRRTVMVCSDVARVFLIGAAAADAALHGPPAVIYLVIGLSAIAASPFRPAEAALTPALARTPEELTAANVVASTVESLGIFGGPAIGGVLLAVSGPGTVFFATAGTILWSAILIAGLHPQPQERRPPDAIGEEVLVGVRTIVRDRHLRLLIGLFSAQTFVDGMLNVLIVVIALKLLNAGKAGVGFLNSAVGVGGLIGALVAAALVGRGRLASDFGLGIVVWGLPIALVAVWPNEVFALVLLAIVGIGNTIVDVSGMTLLQRGAPEEVLARVFGAMEGILLLTLGLGAIVAPAVLSLLGTRGALIVAGALLPLIAIPAWPALAAIDRSADVPVHRLELLRELPMFAPLPESTLEQLAKRLAEADIPAGENVFRQGEMGDRFYVVDRGVLEVLIDGKDPIVLEPGDFFGEIALLRDVPRTATVRARTDAHLYTLGRNEFIPAVTGYAPSREAADKVIGMRLGTARAGLVRA